MHPDNLPDYIVGKVTDFLRALPEEERQEIYALSFWTDCDRPGYYELIFDANTLTAWREAIPRASSPEEAKWNYAFWNQRYFIVAQVKDEDWTGKGWNGEEISTPVTLFDEGRVFTWEEFIEATVHAAQQLHASNIMVELIGRAVPIIIHDLEYGPQSIDDSRRANPESMQTQIDEIVAWVYDF